MVTTNARVQEERLPYSFYVNDEEIADSLQHSLQSSSSTEDVLRIVYQPQVSLLALSAEGKKQTTQHNTTQNKRALW